MYKDRFGVEPICRTLGATEGGFITSRGYRAAKTRPISDREVRDRQLIPVLCEVHARNYGVYGKRKMWKAMVRDGWEIGREQTARLMRQAGLHGIRRGRKPVTTCPSRTVDERPDLVDRNFDATAPNQLWVADILCRPRHKMSPTNLTPGHCAVKSRFTRSGILAAASSSACVVIRNGRG